MTRNTSDGIGTSNKGIAMKWTTRSFASFSIRGSLDWRSQLKPRTPLHLNLQPFPTTKPSKRASKD